MAGNNGQLFLILVDVGTSTPSFIVAAGQRDATQDETNDVIDLSSKDSGRTKDIELGRLTQTLSFTGLHIFGDAARAALIDASRNGTKIKARTEFDGSNVEEADLFVTSRSESHPDQDASLIDIAFEVSGQWAAVS
ncbi:MAG: phage tail tube protein [Gammaproteobacteria bacterium]